MQTRDLIAKVKKIEIKTRRIVDELTGGAYHSVFKGRGIEFDEVREYSYGDDVRDIDWNVTARSGVVHVKKYTEERELTVLLAIDVSASDAFGSTDCTKREKMAETAALLAFSAIRNNDKVSLLLFSDATELYLPPKSGRKHVLRLIRELVGCHPKSTGTDIASALETITSLQKKKAVVFLISDFADEKDFSKAMMIAGKRHDLIAFKITDGLEKNLPSSWSGDVIDAETGERMYFDASKTAANEFNFLQEASSKKFRETCRKASVDVIESDAGEDTSLALMKFFASRKKGAK